MKIRILAIFCFSALLTHAQNWTPIADLPSGRHHPVGWGLNGKGYVATGTNTADVPTADFYEYDPNTDSWSTLPNFPGTARSFAIGVTYQGSGYMGFGATRFNYLNDLWRFDPSTMQWTQLASCPCSGRRHPAMIARGGKIYAGLGDDASGNLRDFWVYDIATNSWSALPDIPALGRHHPFQFVAGNQVFAGMGHNGPFIFNDWFKLDTVTNNWVIMSDFPGEARVAGTQFDFNGDGYVLSGDGDNHSFMPTGEFWQYDYNTDTWTQLTPHPGVSRWAPGSFVIGNEAFFFGGTNRQNGTYPSTAYKYPLAPSGVGLDESGLADLQLFPNPASDFLRWDTKTEISEIRLLNGTGQQVKSYHKPDHRINLEGLVPGMYFVQFLNAQGILHTERLLISQ